MAKIFICDSCKKEFSQPLDEIFYKDEHGVNHIFDMCAPCRTDIKSKNSKHDKDVLGKLIK